MFEKKFILFIWIIPPLIHFIYNIGTKIQECTSQFKIQIHLRSQSFHNIFDTL